MLIRLMGHFINNPRHVDKLIAIKGLPKEWLFREGKDGTELAPPWQADIEANIPEQVRHLCEPTEVTFRFHPIEKGQPWVVDKRTILGIRLDFISEPGRDMWERIERYLENTIPRHERVPVPVLVAKDEHGPFETFTPRRNQNRSLSLEPASVPLIDLNQYAMPPVVASPPPAPSMPVPAMSSPAMATQEPSASSKPQVDSFTCKVCNVEFDKKRALQMHNNRKHGGKVMVAA